MKSNLANGCHFDNAIVANLVPTFVVRYCLKLHRPQTSLYGRVDATIRFLKIVSSVAGVVWTFELRLTASNFASI